MANFIAAIDQDAERLRRFLRDTRDRLSPFSGLQIDGIDGEGWAIAWAAGPGAPISVDLASATVVWGTAIGDEGRLASAQQIAREVSSGDGPQQYDGFYATVSMTSRRQIHATADVLGLFPVYYFQSPNVVLVASSIELIVRHPMVSARLDARGLAGILMTNGLLGGRTLVDGIRRLEPRHRLEASFERVSEHVVHRIPADDHPVGLPFEGHVEVLSESTRSAMKRHLSVGDEFGILLSGGVDSRILAGGISEQGKRGQAMTFGRPEENEASCARAVAQALSMSHRLVDVPSEGFPAAARAFATWDCLSSGFSAIPDWVMAERATGLPTYTVFGHALDGVAGGLHVHWAYDPESRTFGAERFLSSLNSWAFSPRQLRELFRPEVRWVVPEVVEEFRQAYLSASEHPHLQAWHTDLATRHRFHVGIALWVTSFRTWPIAPALDRGLLAAAASLPGSALFHRRAQLASLVYLYPELAALDVDRNSDDTLPLTPRLRDYMRVEGRNRWRRISKRLHLPARKTAPRFYERLYTLDSPGWRAIRRVVESSGLHLPAELDGSRARQFLPPAGRAIPLFDPIADAGRIKALMGLSLVTEHLGLGES